MHWQLLTLYCRIACRVKIDYRPVHMKPLDDEMDFVPPKPRVY
jgi:succinate dehydrogenase (ubiquinone) flavoprotein subunit